MKPVPGIQIEDQPEDVVLRLLAYGEARGEGRSGILAVLHVVRNRALKRDTTMKREALRPLQFSCFNADDPNRAKMLSAWEHDPSGWALCDEAVSAFSEGDTVDDTLGSLNYYVTDMKRPPKWSKPENGWVTRAVIGHHTFGVAA